MVKIPTIENFFYHILKYSFLLPPLLYFLYYKKVKGDRTMLLILCYSLFFFAYSWIEIPKSLRRYYYPSYTFIEYLFFAILLCLNIRNRSFRNIIIGLSVLFVLFQVIYFFTVKIKRLDTIPIGIESILIMIYAFYFLYEQLKGPLTRTIYSHFFFWAATGFVIYLSGSFFIYILAEELDYNDIIKYWFITYIFDILKNILLATTILVFIRNPDPKSGAPVNYTFLDFEKQH